MDRRSVTVVAGVAIGAIALTRLARHHITGRHVEGGILMPDAGAYDRQSRILFGSLFASIASNIAEAGSPGSRVLEVGCGPGHLSVRMAGEHGLDVTGLDLDPAMVARAGANAKHSFVPGRRPMFVVGDVAALPFDNASFDLVVSTFSMHHWSDPLAGLTEIERVLRPGGRALIWDLKASFWLFHAHAPDPAEVVHASPLRVISVRPWRWPWRLTLSQRLELAHA